MGIQNDGAKAGKGLMTVVGAGVAALVLVVVSFLVMGCGDGKGAGGSGAAGTAGAAAAAGTTLDPRVYLPEGAENDQFVVFSANVKAVTKIGVVATLLGDPNIRKDLELAPITIAPNDWEEVLVLVAGDINRRPATYLLIRTNSDGPVTRFSQSADPLEKVGTAGGLEVYAPKSLAGNEGGIVKLSSSLYLMARNVTPVGLSGYLANAGKRKVAVIPGEVADLQKKVGGGDAVVFGMLKMPGANSADVPMAFAGRVGSNVAVSVKTNADIAGEIEQGIRRMLVSLEPLALKVEMARDGGMLNVNMAAEVLAAGGPLDKVMGESLAKAQELANRSSSAANLRGMAMSCQLWAADHQDMFPDHPAQLVAEEGMSAKLLVNKRTQTTPADFSAAELEAGKKDWHAMAAKLEAHNDYLYFGAGLKNFTDAVIIVACEKPAGLKDGINVAYQDGHVEFVRTAGIQAAFEENNRARADKKMKAIPMSGGLPVGP